MSAELPEEAVEAGARAAFWEDDMGDHIMGAWTYDTIPDKGRENYRKMVRATLHAAAPAIRKQRDEELRERLAPITERLERIRDVDEQTSDGSLGSLARHALAALDSIFEAPTQ